MRALLLLAACSALPACAGAADASIELLADAKVSGPTVVLGDVAHLHSADLALMRKLVNLPLGRAPQAGDIALLRQDALVQWVRRQRGAESDRLAWSGAAEARVLRSSPQVSGTEIEKAATDMLRAALEAGGHPAAVQVRNAPRGVDVPALPARLEVRGVEQAATRSRAVLWVDVWSAERFVRTVPVSVDVMQGGPLGDAAPLPAESTRSTRATDDEPLAVSRGDWATLNSSDGVITVQSRVEVLQDGRPGQRVRVRAHGATGPAFARVVGRGQLELLQ